MHNYQHIYDAIIKSLFNINAKLSRFQNIVYHTQNTGLINDSEQPTDIQNQNIRKGMHHYTHNNRKRWSCSHAFMSHVMLMTMTLIYP